LLSNRHWKDEVTREGLQMQLRGRIDAIDQLHRAKDTVTTQHNIGN